MVFVAFVLAVATIGIVISVVVGVVLGARAFDVVGGGTLEACLRGAVPVVEALSFDICWTFNWRGVFNGK